MKTALVLFGLFAAASAAPDISQPAKTDEQVWALAEKVNTIAAYHAYLSRFGFADGAHANEAVRRVWALEGNKGPPLVVPPPPPPRVQPVVDACANLIVDHSESGHGESAEAQAFLDARRSNRPADYSAFLAKYPDSICRGRAEGTIEMRARRRASYSPIPGFGPLTAQARIRAIFTADDYPPIAMDKNEQGRVTAEWDVAEDGIVESCHIIQSSGSAILDYTTCRLITLRTRYDPARDANGVPVRSTDDRTTTWQLTGPPPTPPASPPTH